MRKHLATALLLMVVLNSFSQPFLRQNLATGKKSNQVRWDCHFTYHHIRHAEKGFAGCTESVSSIHDITRNTWYYDEKQAFVYYASAISLSDLGSAGETGKVRKQALPTTTVCDD